MLCCQKIKTAILITSHLACAESLPCPRRCGGYSDSWLPTYTKALSTCNTMTACHQHANCCLCTKKVPVQIHTCFNCSHNWTIVMTS
ncbi:hypothetical protein PGT21_027142 [Puccinia graminis f. sp. tritici]|uniref:Secreted protein n=1 Tax=Puccinia graminis f. sp. tritici TaxID=56615 RepID=A0A5B0NNN3_PUCGR|nr:hypothetical protein PGT21_027142 [Puccinia graminis f. sp. tritici]